VSGWQNVNWPRGLTVSTLDSESSDRGSDPREAFEYFGHPIIRGRAPNQTYSVLEHVMQHWNDIPAACLRRVAEQAVFFLRCVLGTVAILAQGASWAVAVTQAFLPWFKSHDMLKCPCVREQCKFRQMINACFLIASRNKNADVGIISMQVVLHDNNARISFIFSSGGIQSPVALWGWVAECIGSQHVLWIMWMAHPNQADRPQGSHHVSDGILAANDPGIGSGWPQSKQNWARPAVVGH
jgi:hypothetical protein